MTDFVPGSRVWVNRGNGNSDPGKVFVQDGDMVAVELSDGSRAIYHENKVEQR
jgi:hypothetical protein